MKAGMMHFFLLVGVFLGCRLSVTALEEGRAFPIYMFENSNRRGATLDEIRSLVRMSSGCSGFFVKNSKNKNLIMSSRHCYDFEFAEKCLSGGVELFAFDNHGGALGTCKQVVVSSRESDALIFEVEFSDQFTPPDHQFILAARDPEVCTPLQLKGFPADHHRLGRATVSENCWIQPKFSHHAYFSFSEEAKIDALRSAEEVTTTYSDSFWEAFSDLNMEFGLHNCSVYGGNSGGPLQIFGTQIAIGLPMEYLPNSDLTADRRHSVRYERMPEFVERHKDALNELGVQITNDFPTAIADGCVDL